MKFGRFLLKNTFDKRSPPFFMENYQKLAVQAVSSKHLRLFRQIYEKVKIGEIWAFLRKLYECKKQNLGVLKRKSG